MNRRAFLSAGATVVVGGIALWDVRWPGSANASPITTDAAGDRIQQLPRGQLPAFADTDDIRRLYRYAVEHRDELGYIPCTCGCAALGHTSNRDCYVKAFNPDGTITFTSHAAT